MAGLLIEVFDGWRMVTATAERVRLKDGPSDSWKIDGIAYCTKTSNRNEFIK